jgi:hypothetical protein
MSIAVTLAAGAEEIQRPALAVTVNQRTFAQLRRVPLVGGERAYGSESITVMRGSLL